MRTTPVRQQFSGVAEATTEASVSDAPVVSLLTQQRAMYSCPDPLEFGSFQALPLSPDSGSNGELRSKQQRQQAQAQEMLQAWTSAVMQAEESVPRFKLAQGDILLIDNFRCEHAESRFLHP